MNFWRTTFLVLTVFATSHGTQLSAMEAGSDLADEELVYWESMNRLPELAHPPQVRYALPSNYVTVGTCDNRPASALDGVLWAPRELVEKAKEKGAGADGLVGAGSVFTARYMTDVAQVGPSSFSGGGTIGLKNDLLGSGLTDVLTYEANWGPYPLLVGEGRLESGQWFCVAFVGLCTSGGDTILVTTGFSKDPSNWEAEHAVWRQFVRETEYVPIAADQAIKLHLERYKGYNIAVVDDDGNIVASNIEEDAARTNDG